MMKRLFDSLLEKENFWYLFVLLNLLSILSLYIIHDTIITDPKYFTGGNQNSVFLYRKISLIIYFIYPLYCFAKVVIVAGLLTIGLKTQNIEVSFKQLMSVVIIAEIVFWIQDLAQIVWFLFIHSGYTMKEVDNFSFLSLQYFINSEASDALKTITHFFSVPELLFIAMLIFGLLALTKETFSRMAKVVLLTYGLAMIIFLVTKSYILHKMTF